MKVTAKKKARMNNPRFSHKYHMKKIFKFLLDVILYIWQLPQNIVGLFVLLFYPGSEVMEIADVKVHYLDRFPGGISLGNTIMVGTQDRFTAMHEHGHQIQSMILGPLYLFVIGLPSIIWAGLYGSVIPRTHNGYYRFFCESWADKLGGVIRA